MNRPEFLNKNIEDMTAEEYDAYLDYEEQELSGRKKNSRARLLPLYLYMILNENRGRHFTQNELIERLEAYPYEVSVERKSLSRTLHTMEEEFLGVHTSMRDGAWIA